MTDILKLHVDPFKDTRWRVRAENGEPTLASTEGYVHPEDALANAARYLLLEPTDDPDTYVVHTTTEVLHRLQDLEEAALWAKSRAAFETALSEALSQLRRLLQIPGGAR